MGTRYLGCQVTRALLKSGDQIRAKIIESIHACLEDVKNDDKSTAIDVIFLENGCEVTVDITKNSRGVLVQTRIEMPGSWDMDWFTFQLKNLPQAVAAEIYATGKDLHDVVEIDFLKEFRASQIRYGRFYKNLITGEERAFALPGSMKSKGDRIDYHLVLGEKGPFMEKIDIPEIEKVDE